MTLVIKKPTGGKLVFARDFKLDSDAQAYITAVEAVDGQALETATRYAINNFVIGCKQDGIWPAIKASCILAGARTLNGALVPLVGAAPTNFNFVSGDYNRKTGLLGNGTSKYLNSNRNNNADPLDNVHLAVWKNDQTNSANPYFIGSATSGASSVNAVGQSGLLSNSSGFVGVPFTSSAIGLHGISRSNSSSVVIKRPSIATTSQTLASTIAPTVPHFVFNININGTPGTQWSASRITFYSIGESLNLALLDARVTDLINAFGAAIP